MVRLAQNISQNADPKAQPLRVLGLAGRLLRRAGEGDLGMAVDGPGDAVVVDGSIPTPQ